MFISISYFCKFYKSTYVLLENSVHLLVGVKSKDTTKPKFRRRKDLLLIAASKEDTEVCHKQCCSLQHRTLLLSPVTSAVGFCFCFGSIPSFFLEFFLQISSSILGTYQPGEFLFQCPIFLPFHTVHGVLKARILKWFAIPVSSGPHSVRPLHHDLPVLGGPTGHGLVSLS